MEYAFLIFLVILSKGDAAFKCSYFNDIAQDGQGKVKLTAIPFEGGFTAKWKTIDTEYVELVHLEWICYPANETKPKEDPTAFVNLSERTSGEANITVNNSSMECVFSGCYIDSDFGDVNTIESVTITINMVNTNMVNTSTDQAETLPSSTTLLPLISVVPTSSPTDCVCAYNVKSKRSIDDTGTEDSHIHYYIIGFLGTFTCVLAILNVFLMVVLLARSKMKMTKTVN